MQAATRLPLVQVKTSSQQAMERDLIYGEAGDDQIKGEGGKDTVYGGEGDDLIEGGVDSDLVYGDSGDDVFTVEPVETCSSVVLVWIT